MTKTQTSLSTTLFYLSSVVCSLLSEDLFDIEFLSGINLAAGVQLV
jgi:hypothetical protein